MNSFKPNKITKTTTVYTTGIYSSQDAAFSGFGSRWELSLEELVGQPPKTSNRPKSAPY